MMEEDGTKYLLLISNGESRALHSCEIVCEIVMHNLLLSSLTGLGNNFIVACY